MPVVSDTNRVAFLVDGFNVYHSIRDVERQVGDASAKWLDLRSLCMSYLYRLDGYAELEAIHYFTAYAGHRSPETVNRHKRYIRCLKDTGVTIELAQFKEKSIRCKKCGRQFTKQEEKETDVAIAARLLEILVEDRCDTAVIVSGDTDLASAYRTASRLVSDKTVTFAFPYNRANSELKQLSEASFKVGPQQYLNHQFDDPHVLADGTEIDKPSSW